MKTRVTALVHSRRKKSSPLFTFCPLFGRVTNFAGLVLKLPTTDRRFGDPEQVFSSSGMIHQPTSLSGGSLGAAPTRKSTTPQRSEELLASLLDFVTNSSFVSFSDPLGLRTSTLVIPTSRSEPLSATPSWSIEKRSTPVGSTAVFTISPTLIYVTLTVTVDDPSQHRMTVVSGVSGLTSTVAVPISFSLFLIHSVFKIMLDSQSTRKEEVH